MTNPNRCAVPGCTQSRYVNGSGKTQTYCLNHWREKKREYNERYFAKKYPDRPVVPFGKADEPAACPLCGRTPEQAAQFALLHHVTCNRCMPTAPRPRKSQPKAETNGSSDDSMRLEQQLTEANRQVAMLRAAVSGEDARILVLDFDEGCLRWLTGCQERSEPMPATTAQFVELQRRAVRDGYFIARRHSADVRESLEPLGLERSGVLPE